MSLDVLKETEWYENVRNGFIPLCDRCLDVKKEQTNINREQFINQQNQRGVYCDNCWNYTHLQYWECGKCNTSGTHRSERKLTSCPTCIDT